VDGIEPKQWPTMTERICKMTFKTALKKLKKIADGKYLSINYEFTKFSDKCDGVEEASCTVYIDGYNRHSGPTWKAAFDKLEIEMKGPQPVDPKEQPL
jgi:hypothetical protein